MTGFAYVGNAEDAAGFRLAGLRTWAPCGDADAAFRAALASGAEAVFLTPAVAEGLPRTLLDAALIAARPLVVVLPESDGTPSRCDPAERVRAQLGLDA